MNHPLVAIPIFLPIALISLAVGGTILHVCRVRPFGMLEQSVFATALGFGVLAYLILGVGLVGALTLPVLVILLFFLATASCSGLRSLAPSLYRALRNRLRSVPRAFNVIVLLSAAILGAFVLMAALAPPSASDWDGLAYHLAVPKLYLAAHRIFYVPFTSHSNFPFVTEMLYTLGLALQGPSVAKLFHYAMYLLTAAGIFTLCRRHLNRTAGSVGALLFMSVPIVVWEAGVAYADLSTGMFVLLAVYAVLNWEQAGERGWLAVAGVMCGFALGTKMLAVVPVAAICLWALWAGRSKGWGTGLKCAALAGLFAAFIGAPWYVKTWLYTGNPVYPFFFNVFGGRNWTQADADLYRAAQQSMGMGRSAVGFLAAPWNLTVNGFRFYDFPAVFGLIGPAFLGLLALPILAGRMERPLLRIAFVSAVFVAAWFFLMQNARYMIAVLPLLSIFAGYGAAVALSHWRIGRFIADIFVVICVAVGMLTSILLVVDGARVAVGLESAESYLSRTLAPYDAQAFINSSTPTDAKVLLFKEPRGFYLERAYIWADPGHHQLIPWQSFRSDGDMVRFLRKRGYTHAIINWAFMKGDEPYEQMIFQAIGRGRLLEVYSSQKSRETVTVYEVRSP